MSTPEGGSQDPKGLASSTLADSGGPQMTQAHHMKFARSHDEKPNSSLHREIAMTLSRDVEKMINQAKHDSESKVKTELISIRSEIDAVTEKIESYFAMGANMQKDKSALHLSENIVDKRTLTEFVQKIEHRWMMEMRALKQELHQTILAHNHNADLMKHLKDAMDQIRMQLDERNLPQNEQWMRCIPHIDEFLRQSTQRDRQLQSITPKLDSLLLRVESLESQILVLSPAPFPSSSLGGPPSGLGALGGGRPALEAGPSGWGLKDAPPPAATYHMLNRWTQDGPGQAAREQHKETRKEQLQQQQLQLQLQAEKEKKEEKEKRGDLRAAAPVFVPKSSEGPSSQNGSSEKGKATRKMSSPQQPGPPSSQQQQLQLQQSLPVDKMESVGAPPGLPPPPGLSMEPQSM
eukprot:GEMP01007372.1.p1 GENE.GEMP01007372.1~~GEMP01007372.1.p1  ORF type:complete len:406 (+),score=103.73 GEMP01007372.1:55-1272(+)